MLYLEPPWKNLHFGDSVFGFDNVIFWDADAAIIASDWAVRWMEPGDEEAVVERAVFGVRSQYEKHALKQERRHRRWWRGHVRRR
ncbi:MAG: hypothetical protein HGA44_08120 [Cellulomonadaceae bacterium]|nr:hypothetical protein [Cellulomonadaceae bacterium]